MTEKFYAEFYEPLYGVNVYVCFGANNQKRFAEELRTLWKRKKKAKTWKNCDGWCDSQKSGDVAIWIRRKNDLSVLGHECLHAATHVMRRRGIDIRKEDEPLCYYWQFLFDKIREL